MASVYDFAASRLGGAEERLAVYRGQSLLIVNVASQCGFTTQYAGLETLYRTYKDKGFSVLGFPCNQFGAQEPGDAKEIRRFCDTQYGVSFPMFAKIDVNGAGAHPLYRFLTSARRGLFGTRAIKWNFTKFLTDRAGHVVARIGPATKPETLGGAINKHL